MRAVANSDTGFDIRATESLSDLTMYTISEGSAPRLRDSRRRPKSTFPGEWQRVREHPVATLRSDFAVHGMSLDRMIRSTLGTSELTENTPRATEDRYPLALHDIGPMTDSQGFAEDHLRWKGKVGSSPPPQYLARDVRRRLK